MGNFSFKCKASKKAAMNNFNSGVGSPVYMFLLKDGKVIEKMHGNYDGYGNVDGLKWKMAWSDVCDLMFSDNEGDGIALYRAEHYTEQIPTTQSSDDPYQGDKRNEKAVRINSPYHKVYAHFKSGAEIKADEVKKMIIENFIEYFTTDEDERERMKSNVDMYIDLDHVQEIIQSYPNLNE